MFCEVLNSYHSEENQLRQEMHHIDVVLAAWSLMHWRSCHLQRPSAYEKGYPGYPGIPLSDLKPVGLWSHPEALRGLLKPSEARWSPQRLLEALRGSPKSSKAPSKASEACRGSLRPFEALQLMVFLSDLNSRRTWNSKGIPRKFLSPYADVPYYTVAEWTCGSFYVFYVTLHDLGLYVHNF